MVYIWQISFNGTVHKIKAGSLHTALHRVGYGEKALEGTIHFKRLQNVRRKTCNVCHTSYEDNPESKKHHFEVYIYHKQAVEEAKLKEGQTTLNKEVV